MGSICRAAGGEKNITSGDKTHKVPVKFYIFNHPFVPTPKGQGDRGGLDLLWWDGSTGIRASVLAVEAIDDHPLLVGAEIQSVPACRRSAECLAVFLAGNLNATHLYSARFLPGAAHPRA